MNNRGARRFLAAAAATGLALLAAQPASALVINVSYDSSVTSQANAAVIESAFNTVAQDYASSFSNPVTVNVGVSWGSVGGYALPSTAVGASLDYLYGYFSYSNVKGFLASSAASNPSDTALATASGSLPGAAPPGVSQYVVPSAEAKALGLIPGSQSSIDGFIGFAGSPSNYDFNPTDGVGAHTFDFQGVAAHELAEVLGRISGLSGKKPAYRTPLDLFRYSAPGTIGFAYKAPAYLSINSGVTDLGDYNYTGTGDRSDWLTLSSSRDVQDAYVSKGQRLALTSADLTALDVLGWGGSNLGDTPGSPTRIAFNLSSVPEPGVWAMMICGAGLTGLRLRSRRRLVAAVA